MQDDESRLITIRQRRIQRAQGRARRYLKPGASLADELRRKAAKCE
jgi:hypothetical protein